MHTSARWIARRLPRITDSICGKLAEEVFERLSEAVRIGARRSFERYVGSEGAFRAGAVCTGVVLRLGPRCNARPSGPATDPATPSYLALHESVPQPRGNTSKRPGPLFPGVCGLGSAFFAVLARPHSGRSPRVKPRGSPARDGGSTRPSSRSRMRVTSASDSRPRTAKPSRPRPPTSFRTWSGADPADAGDRPVAPVHSRDRR